MTLPGKVSCALALFLSLGALAAAQVNGPEFGVNTYTTGAQGSVRVAADGGGRFIVAWAGTGPGDTRGIFARRYRSSGTPIGNEFLVNTAVGSSEGFPAVAADAEAGFVVVWEASGSYGYEIFARRFTASGAPIGVQFQVNSFITGDQYASDVALAPDGTFVVVWNDWQYGFPYDYFTIWGQRFAANGTPVGGEFQVSTFGTAAQYHPKVARGEGGSFIVVWDGWGSLDDAGIFGHRFNAAGNSVGGEFRVNSDIAPWDAYPSIATDASGAFVVSWQSGPSGNPNDWDIFARRFNSAGNAALPEFRINTYTPGGQYGASVGSDHLGNFVVAWHGLDADGYYDVTARRYDSNGNPRGGEFRVNTYTADDQFYASVAVDPRENFLVVWQSDGQDGSGSGIFGQRFGDFIFGYGFQ
jgi:hypothetical protein